MNLFHVEKALFHLKDYTYFFHPKKNQQKNKYLEKLQSIIAKRKSHFFDGYYTRNGILNLSFTFFYDFAAFIASKYLANCFLTTGNKKNSPIILGNTIAKIIASEKSQIDFILADAPITTNSKNNNL